MKMCNLIVALICALAITPLINLVNADASERWQIGLQDPATPAAEGMAYFHNYIMVFLIIIGVMVLVVLIEALASFFENYNTIAEKFTHSSILEIVWTILPAFILIILAIPSFALLYSLDELIDPTVTLKVVGHQWYWSYEYSDFAQDFQDNSVNFDSYMTATNELQKGHFRLLEVDNRVLLPVNTHIRVLVTAADVLHSWAIPSFGIKIDACPGRLSQGSIFIKREGYYYGQCSEICGVNHGFMPIVVRGVKFDSYTTWLIAKSEEITLDRILGK